MKLKIECDTEEEKKAAREFLSWMDNQGEQDYWTAIEDQAPEEPFIRDFKYDMKKLEVQLVLNKKE